MPTKSPPTFGDLFEQVSRRVLALGFQLTGDRHLAEEVLQETFLAVHRSLPRFRGEADPATWVYRIALNAGRRIRARRERERRDAAATHAPRHAPAAPPALTHPDANAALFRALDALSPDHREVLSLMALRELPAPVIAQVLGIPVGTVHSRAFHARAALRALLRDEESPALERSQTGA